MTRRRAQLKVIAGPNQGDSLSIELGSCRLIGRHLSESETTLMDRHGNRQLEAEAATILEKHLEKHLEQQAKASSATPSDNLQRGPDIVFGDDSISRAHAMVFFERGNLGVIDLASTNGTFVNEERVNSSVVQDGDVLCLGNVELAVQIR